MTLIWNYLFGISEVHLVLSTCLSPIIEEETGMKRWVGSTEPQSSNCQSEALSKWTYGGGISPSGEATVIMWSDYYWT